MATVQKSSSLRSYGKLAIIAVAIIGSLAGYKYWKISKAMAMSWAPPPESVPTIIVKEESWVPKLDFVGSLGATQGFTLSTEEPGTVTAIKFESGSAVKKGQVLVQLDTSVEEAQLKAANAKQELARVNLKRVEELRAADATSVQAWNSAVADMRQGESEVERISAVIRRKTVSAPFDGRAGIRAVNIGQYVTPGTAIVPLFALNPIFINFSVPQQQFGQIKTGQKVDVLADAYPKDSFSGTITAIDPQVDEINRSVRVQATVPNQDERLTPGMFGRVAVLLGQAEPVIAIPTSAISYNPYGNAVYVVGQITLPDQEPYLGVKQQFITLGVSKGDKISVVKGLKVGDEVVTAAPFKLHPNAKVVVNNSIGPENNLNPNPEDS